MAKLLGWILQIRCCSGTLRQERCAGQQNCVRLPTRGGRRPKQPSAWRKPWQLRGVGTALMAGLVQEASRRGTEHIHLACHLHNRPMQRIAQKAAAQIRLEEDDCLAHITVRRVPPQMWLAASVGYDWEPAARVVMEP
jgi:hypothetical protein